MRWLCLATVALAGCRMGDLVQTPDGGPRLRFSVQPTRADPGEPITPPVQVSVLDESGRLDTVYPDSVVVALAENTAGAALSGTTVAAVDGGVATFSDLRLDKPGRGYVLRASAPERPAVMSTAFEVTGGSEEPVATRLVFVVQPGATQAGSAIAPAVQVAARDSAGNTITTYSGTITITIGTNPGGGTLSGTTAVAAANGVATFGNLRIDRVGNGYTLTAAATGLTGATSSAFNVTAPPPPPPPPQAVGLRFIVQPSNTGLNQAISPPVQVMVLDAQGNQVPSYTGAVTIDLAPNLLNATVFGTTTVNAVNGIATFSNLRVNLVGVDFRLRAALAGQAPIVTSNAFVVLL